MNIFMKQLLVKFKNMDIRKADLQNELGMDLHNVVCKSPQIIYAAEVENAIRALLNGTVSIEQLVEWVNVIWFTEFFEFNEKEVDSILSVLEVLETLDEENVTISVEEYHAMITALSNNHIFI